ncbi:hypothetical protein CLOM_g11542 [Closterium sp. NIES-68]|nr:hypothetical protein CLOM_g20070 [Closterium sp. NIES-68]GJP52429.1 hypothetical protein CLOM_g11542 [Closterium sp. NIES-68]GJP73947.1 hypothetical protein CLOP_g4611 [Closterium sp. NIES-67]
MANQSLSAGAAAAARAFSAQSGGDSGGAGGGSEGKQLIASLLVERLPVVIPKPPEWALKYETFSFERKQQYRKQYPKEFLDAAASSNAGAEGEGEEEDEYWAAVLEAPFDAPSRRTAADEANDVRSLQRSLDKRLYLVLKGPSLAGQSGGDTWHFPEKIYENEDSMRQCAERAAAASFGSSLSLYFVGNAPCAHAPLPASTAFFFRAQVMGGDFEPAARTIKDFAWVSKSELPEYVDFSSMPNGTELFHSLLVDE